MMASTDRRALLRGFAKLPLIGGTLAIVGAPSAPVSLVQAATLSGIADPRERALCAWEAFSSAMDDLTADANGWRILGAARVHRASVMEPWSYLKLAEVFHGRGGHSVVVEQHREISLDPLDEAVIRAREAVRNHREMSNA